MFTRIQWRITCASAVLVVLVLFGLGLYLNISLHSLELAPAALEPTIDNVLKAVTVAAILAVAASFLVGSLVARATADPVLALTRAIERLEAGELNDPVLVDARDEVGRLGGAFNHMAQRLRNQVVDAERESARLAATLTYMADGLIIADGDGVVRLMNPAAGRLLQIDSEWAVGRSLVAVVRDHELASMVTRSLIDEDVTPEPRIIDLGARAGGRRTVQAMASQVPSAHDIGRQVLLILQDVTELQRLESVRREFVANVSHELRTPVAGLKALVETLEAGAIDDHEAAREFLGHMQVEVDRLAELVEDLLELSRIESGHIPLNMAPTAIPEVVAVAVQRMLPLAERQGVRLAIENGPERAVVLADGSRIEQVVINLVHNAVKFTPPGGAITVRTQLLTDEVTVQVVDTGVGIAPEALPRLFERFFKADRARVSGLGTGLGLAIAKHLVQAHGGRIWADSDGEGKGATFTFALPVTPTP